MMLPPEIWDQIVRRWLPFAALQQLKLVDWQLHELCADYLKQKLWPAARNAALKWMPLLLPDAMHRFVHSQRRFLQDMASYSHECFVIQDMARLRAIIGAGEPLLPYGYPHYFKMWNNRNPWYTQRRRHRHRRLRIAERTQHRFDNGYYLPSPQRIVADCEAFVLKRGLWYPVV